MAGKEPTERQQLEREKQELAQTLGIWQAFTPVENYRDTEAFARIREIDKRLSEICIR